MGEKESNGIIDSKRFEVFPVCCRVYGGQELVSSACENSLHVGKPHGVVSSEKCGPRRHFRRRWGFGGHSQGCSQRRRIACGDFPAFICLIFVERTLRALKQCVFRERAEFISVPGF